MQFPAPSETFACEDVKALLRQNSDVSVYALRGKHRLYDKLISQRGISTIKISHYSYSNFLLGILLILCNSSVFIKYIVWLIRCESSRPSNLIKAFFLSPRVFVIWKELEKKKPDVVHLFWGHMPSLVGWFALNQLHYKPIVSIFLGAYDLNRKMGISKYVAKNASVVFTHTKCNLAEVNRIAEPNKNIKVIYRGINFDLIDFYKQKRPDSFLSAGRLIKEKGFDDLIVFFSKFCSRNRNARLSIAGDGPDRSRLEMLAKDLGVDSRVFFLGHIPHNDLLNLMSESQFFILFSRYESDRLPNVIKEAMACGCLCVATDILGNDELIIDNFTGILCPKADMDFAANKLGILIHSPEAMNKILLNARGHIARYFDVNKNMALYLEELLRLKDIHQLC